MLRVFPGQVRDGTALTAGAPLRRSLDDAAESLEAVEQRVALLDDRLVQRALHIRAICLEHTSHLRMVVPSVCGHGNK